MESIPYSSFNLILFLRFVHVLGGSHSVYLNVLRHFCYLLVYGVNCYRVEFTKLLKFMCIVFCLEVSKDGWFIW